MLDVVALGELLIDFTPIKLGGRSSFQQNAGGAPANVAVVAAHMGKRTAFIGKVGDDAFGKFLRQTLVDYGVNTEGVCVSERFPTTLAFVHLDDLGERSFSFYRNSSADVMLQTSDLKPEMLLHTRVFHFGSVSMTSNPSRAATLEAVRIAKAHGAIITFDANLRLSLWTSEEEARQQIEHAMQFVDVLKLSEEELSFLTGETTVEAGVSALARRNPHVAVILVTMGAKGCYYVATAGAEAGRALSEGRVESEGRALSQGRVESRPVQAVDTTGAGDAFMGAFLTGLLDAGKGLNELASEELENILHMANACGALTTTKPGGIPALPTKAELDAFMSGHPS